MNVITYGTIKKSHSGTVCCVIVIVIHFTSSALEGVYRRLSKLVGRVYPRPAGEPKNQVA